MLWVTERYVLVHDVLTRFVAYKKIPNQQRATEAQTRTVHSTMLLSPFVNGDLSRPGDLNNIMTAGEYSQSTKNSVIAEARRETDVRFCIIYFFILLFI